MRIAAGSIVLSHQAKFEVYENTLCFLLVLLQREISGVMQSLKLGLWTQHLRCCSERLWHLVCRSGLGMQWLESDLQRGCGYLCVQYMFKNATDGNAFASKLFDSFVPSLSGEAKPVSINYGPWVGSVIRDWGCRLKIHVYASPTLTTCIFSWSLGHIRDGCCRQ